MRYLVGLTCVLALGVMGCSETTGNGGAAGDGGNGGTAGDGGNGGTGLERYAWCEVEWLPLGGGDGVTTSFPDPLIGTVVGGIYRTTDGGVTWAMEEGPLGDDSYLDVMFTDVTTGTIVGWGGTILRTTHGGDSWVAQDSGTDVALYGVSFADASTGLAVGEAGTILRTTDGGETWVSQASGTDARLYAVWLSDDNTATAVGASGTILRTTDGGTTWVAQDSGSEFPLSAVSFASRTTGVAVGWEGVILRTTDGGATWTPMDDFSPVPLNDVWFADASVGTIVGASGTILRTTDAGATWAYEPTDSAFWEWDTPDSDPVRVPTTLNGVSMSDPSNGVAAGEHFVAVRRMTIKDNYGVCDPWCTKVAQCYPQEVAGCDIDCLCNLRYHFNISPECERAVVESLRCFSALTCEQIEAYYDNPYNHPCTAAEEQLDIACGFVQP